MIGKIIEDAKTMETEAIRAEEAAQKAYEDFVKESNASIEEKTKNMINKTEERSKDEKAKVQADKKYDKEMLELEQLGHYNTHLHTTCDFLMKNYEQRQANFDEEAEALKEAMAIFSGAIEGTGSQ